GIPRGSTCRHQYGLKFIEMTGQTKCAYCGLDFLASYGNWLQMALDHVVPKSVCKNIGIQSDWAEDCINKVLACSACNGFDNRYSLREPTICPESLEQFCRLRDRIFSERRGRV